MKIQYSKYIYQLHKIKLEKQKTKEGMDETQNQIFRTDLQLLSSGESLLPPAFLPLSKAPQPKQLQKLFHHQPHHLELLKYLANEIPNNNFHQAVINIKMILGDMYLVLLLFSTIFWQWLAALHSVPFSTFYFSFRGKDRLAIRLFFKQYLTFYKDYN